MSIVPCSVTGCEAHKVCRGWCSFHYSRWKLAGDPNAPLKRMSNAGRTCSFDGCDTPSRKLGYCSSHYSQISLGRPLAPLVKKSKGYTCAFCFGPSGTLRGFRKHCSPACRRLYYKHGGPLPEKWTCLLCKDSFDFTSSGTSRRTQFNRKLCAPCRKNSAKHGYSAAQLALRDGTDCKLCGASVDMTLRHPHLMRGSVDHIVPTSRGGSNEPENVQLAHLRCNIRKHNRLETELVQ